LTGKQGKERCIVAEKVRVISKTKMTIDFLQGGRATERGKVRVIIKERKF